VTRYAADSRDRVLEAIDMVSLVGARVQLRRAGVNSYFGNCPFHDERTGSFHVSPDERLYHCFGCQASGDAFTYVMETEGLDFKEALESLAERFGVGLQSVEEDPQAQERRRHRDRLHELLGRTTSFYERSLWETAEAHAARDYLAGRGLEPETLRAFHVGYAPDSFDRVLIGSRKAGFSEQELVDAGLVRRSARSRAGAVDFFREQIMFPAADARGRVRGFGARRMRDDQPVAKYVNTPDGVLYHKREVLFGIDLARAEAAKQGRMILVEGYTDVLACHQAGIRNVVGIMGTSFTEEQLTELERVVKVLELCLDADSAGQEAVLRAARLAAGRHLELRVIVLPEGSDPADLAQSEGAQALGTRLGASIPFVTFDVERILSRGDCVSAEGRDRALAELAPAFATLGPSVLRDQLIRRVSGALELSDARVAGLLADPPPVATPRGGDGGSNGGNGRRGGSGATGRPGRDDDPPGSPPASAPPAPGTRSERLFLALCIAVPDAGERALGEGEAQLLFGSEALRRVARHLRGRTHTPLSDLPVDDEPFARVVAGLVQLAGRVLTPNADRLEHARLVLDLDRLERAILRARAEGEGTNELAREREQAREAYRDVVSRLEGTL
jgi:DNA primase